MSAPRYRQLADSLVRDIASSRYPVGSLLPPEVRISEQYGVSRHTAREAIRRLVGMGLISRRPGIGTQVKARKAPSRFIASLTSISDLFQYTQRTRLKLLAERMLTADAALAARLRCARGERWVQFETCRYSIGAPAPISHTEIYVLPAHAGIRNRLEGAGVWVYGLIEQASRRRIVELQQVVSAVAMPVRIGKLLHAKAHSPALRVLRYYYGARGRLISVSVNLYPEGRFEFSTRWRLEWGVDKP